jgi:hypothetical protein
MWRPWRPTSREVVYHVLNRANARRTLFENEGDYAAFARVLEQPVRASPAASGVLQHTQSLASRRLATT